ncbi:threonine/serine exporter family protein [Nocardia pseudobrasiliensis]|uniref:Uncharacterized membrane protein YjjP (DUF1212 family) n=1 Tax=Nocardia pseudobrasiliensis TaxID=45979 RepID=A0A370I7X6_9NOCA|nr:threonine/serine exporter family protein [Nocardia pseudobrasiliensis]RDI66822.1 uncharacterized membrane protein YjjP (DUF1212 family) [Nocardia pseudobrasiliensis]
MTLEHTTPSATGRAATAPPPVEVLDMLRRLGVALLRSSETTMRVQTVLTELAHRYGYADARIFVLPTGVWVRLADSDGDVHLDLLDTATSTLRMDQIDEVYRLIATAQRARTAPRKVVARLDRILRTPPPTPVWLAVVGNVVLTVGFGLMLNPSARTLIGYLVLGVVVQLIIMLTEKTTPRLAFAIPFSVAAAVTLLAFGLPGPLSGGHPTDLLVPGVAALLPGALLTTGAIEISAGSLVSGVARLASGVMVLLQMGFGIILALQLTSHIHTDYTISPARLGTWAPLLGVALIGLGYLWRASAPARAIGWTLLVLYLTYTAKLLGDLIGRPLVGPFLAGLILIPLTSVIARRFRSAPTAQVMGLPAFWMLVPGSMGVTAVSDLIRHQTALGTQVIATALATILAIAVGTLMGSGLNGPDRPEPDCPQPSASAATDRPATPASTT